jgi:cell division protein FtsB
VGEKGPFMMLPLMSLKLRLFRYRRFVFLTAVMTYFLVQALTGQNGLLSGLGRYQEWQNKKNQLAALDVQVKDMQRQTEGLRSSHLNLDLIEERIRADLGYASPTEQVILVRPLPQEPPSSGGETLSPQP